MTYQRIADSDNIKRINDDGSMSYIPNDPANRDRIAYQKWVEEGHEPEPAD